MLYILDVHVYTNSIAIMYYKIVEAEEISETNSAS